MARAALPRTNAELYARACEAIPGGVNSSIRAFKAVGGTPYMVDRAEGAFVIDVEGRRYVDLVQSYGAIILGHAHPSVVQAVAAAASNGMSYGAPTPGEVRLAEAIADRVPSCERVRLMNSGTEATSTAVRLARGFTGRDRVVIFHGNFHGATDALLAAGGSGVATPSLPGTAGVPAGAVANTMVVPYNRVPQLDEHVAAVIVEPVAANMGVVGPQPGFLEALRAECDRVGALLVFDEVITGFRVARGGAQERYGVTPDLTILGKIVGGGLPLAEGYFGLGRFLSTEARYAESVEAYRSGFGALAIAEIPSVKNFGIAGAVGTILGLISGYFGRWIDALIMRTADAMLSFPLILIALLFAVTLGPSFTNLIIVLALVMWARFARLVQIGRAHV